MSFLESLRSVKVSLDVKTVVAAATGEQDTHPNVQRTNSSSASVFLVYKLLNQLVLYPYVFSPLRKLPGPRGSLLSIRYLLLGEFPAIMAAEAGILQREWAKVYGTVMRAVGPFGMERVMFLSPPAMQRVLVDDWVEYPRVRSLPTQSLINYVDGLCLAKFHAKRTRDRGWLRAPYSHWGRAQDDAKNHEPRVLYSKFDRTCVHSLQAISNLNCSLAS